MRLHYKKRSDGVDRATGTLTVALDMDEVTLIRQIAKERGVTFHAVLKSCFYNGLEALGEQHESEPNHKADEDTLEA